MVYRRRYGYRRNRRYGRKRGTNWGYYARTGFKLATRAMGLLNTEKKFSDGYATGSTSSTTPAIIHLSNISRGTGEAERIGGSVMPKDLLLKIDLAKHATPTTTLVRFILFTDTENESGTPPTAGQILQEASATINLISPLEKDYAGRFKIMRDIQVRLDSGKMNSTIDIYHKFGMYKNQEGLRVNAPHITWGVSDQTERGHIYLMHMSDQPSTVPTFSFYKRLQYIDN